MMTFEEEICAVINRHSQENLSNTPDFILASYLMDCMNTFDVSVNAREAWYGCETSEVQEHLPHDPSEPCEVCTPTALDRQKEKQ